MKKWIWLMLALALGVAGCTSRPILNVDNQAVVTAGKTATMQDVERAILKAGASLGWTMSPVRPGLVTGRITLRTHVAVVDITYDARAFSIKYKESTGLDYANGNIHKNYNGWIENLDREIRANLLKL